MPIFLCIKTVLTFSEYSRVTTHFKAYKILSRANRVTFFISSTVQKISTKKCDFQAFLQKTSYFRTFTSIFSERLKIWENQGNMLHLEFDKL